MSAKALHKSHTHPNDCIHTPKPIADLMIKMCDIKPSDTVLDPCRGGGVFFDNIDSINKEYCEIQDGKDFFENTKHYTTIIGNPPYSKWTEWIEHTLNKCQKFCYIFGAQSLTPNRIKMIHDAGYGLTKLHTVKIAWFMSQSYICLFEKGKPSIISITPGTFNCEYCNTNCHRGIYGNDPNICNIDNKKMKAEEKKRLKAEKKSNDPLQ